MTHHHGDHTGGIAELKQKHNCRVVAPPARPAKIPLVDETVSEGDKVSVGNLSANVIETPGHTAGHITYWFHADKLAFAGDTLFSIGCGRVIEGTPEMMWESLLKLRDLPDDTRVYCGHEYTLANIKFAQTIEPDNTALKARAAQAAKQIAEAVRPFRPRSARRRPRICSCAPTCRRSRRTLGLPASRPRRCSPRSGRGRISFEGTLCVMARRHHKLGVMPGLD